MTGRILSGKYRVEGLIGTGGMAHVYKATQIYGPRRTVALKILKEEYQTDKEFIRRFEQEAAAVLNLSHDNIVRSFDVGQDGDCHYIVLEYVEGKTLKELIKERAPMSMKNAVHIAVQVLEALSRAHECGIIHRDVKPQNVLLNAKNRAKLADFGIARNADASTMTFAGSNVMGSVHYLSPEQAKGRPVTVESDIYSMGITLFEMVTGAVPFSGDNSVSVALKHLQEDMPEPASINPKVTPAMNDIIMRATNKNPQDRYHSARAMRRDLLRALKEPNGTFARMLATPEPEKKGRVHKGVVRIGVICLLVIGILTAVFLMGSALLRRETISTTDKVPTLIGKTLEEAKNTAKLRTYNIEVTDTIESAIHAPGVVISQVPDAGASLKAGGTISITMSAGVLMPVVPELTGMTLAQAEETLLESGLQLGTVEYRVTEHPLGVVYQQEPAAGETVFERDYIDVFVSGEASANMEMPSVLQQSLPDALSVLQEWGFTKFLVRRQTPEESMGKLKDGVVYVQSPAAGESVTHATPVTLTVSRALPGSYGANILLQLTPEQPDTVLTVTMPCVEAEVAYEELLYEAVLPEGAEQQISFSATADVGDNQELIVYLNGVELRRTNVMFTYWG